MCVHIYVHVYILCMIVLLVTQTLLIVSWYQIVISSTLVLYVTIVCNKFPHEIICSYKLFVVHYSCMLLVWSKFPLQHLQSAKTDN